MLFFPSGTPFGPPDPWDDTEISEEGADFLSALSFTVALWQIMLPLLAGGAILCLVAWACEHAGRALHRQYQIRMRRGYYWFERREEEARRKFAEGCRELIGTPGDYSRRYRALLDAFRSELNEIEEERRRDWAEHWKPDPAFAWSSPKAVAGRERRRAKHAAAWRAWAEKFAAAVRLGKAPPDPPSGRRGGNGGAPIRRLCERSLNPPPTPEALAAQWEKAHGRGPVEEKLRLGSMMLDIEATVDSSLVRNTDGEIVGRNPGLRGWLRENCPEMMRHYRMLMDCRHRPVAQGARAPPRRRTAAPGASCNTVGESAFAGVGEVSDTGGGAEAGGGRKAPDRVVRIRWRGKKFPVARRGALW